MSLRITAKKWYDGPDGHPTILGSITTYKEATRENKFRLRRLIYKKFPALDFYVLCESHVTRINKLRNN